MRKFLAEPIHSENGLSGYIYENSNSLNIVSDNGVFKLNKNSESILVVKNTGGLNMIIDATITDFKNLDENSSLVSLELDNKEYIDLYDIVTIYIKY